MIADIGYDGFWWGKSQKDDIEAHSFHDFWIHGEFLSFASPQPGNPSHDYLGIHYDVDDWIRCRLVILY